jgi:hypothetical protein
VYSFHDPARECEVSELKSREAAGIDIDSVPHAITACPYGILQLLTGTRFVKPRHRCHEATLTKAEERLGWIAKAPPSALGAGCSMRGNLERRREIASSEHMDRRKLVGENPARLRKARGLAQEQAGARSRFS